MAVPPEEKATPEWQAKNAAGKAFKAARASLRDAKDRKDQIKAQINAGGLTAAGKRALKDELQRLKETIPALAKKRRSTRVTWQGLKDRYETPPVAKGP